MNLGDTFIWSPTFQIPHLYIVLSSPEKNDGKFVAANLTESVHGQKSFILKAGCHPFVFKDSDINFGDSLIIDVKKIEHAISIGHATPHQPMDTNLVKKIAKAAIEHPAVAIEIQEMLAGEWT